MRWTKAGYGVYRCGRYRIEKTANPTAFRRWYVTGGSSAFDRQLVRYGAVDMGFFALSVAKRAVEKAHADVQAKA